MVLLCFYVIFVSSLWGEREEEVFFCCGGEGLMLPYMIVQIPK